MIHTITAQNKSIHAKINTDMYENFSKAYKTLDFDLFASIHSKDMIRISGDGGQIKDVKTYLKRYQKRWSDSNRKPSPIDFRLFERVYSDSLVSDRGIYRVTYSDDKNQTKYSYGQFHVVLRLENGLWKILLDYDSNENKSINKERYELAFPLSEYKKYWKH
ncbi:hypothetical protein GCM10022259_32160 [Aquimarina mytili]